MKVTAISDTHNEHDNLYLDSGDILIHAGDAGIKGTFTEMKNFLDWLVKQPFKYKVFVPGNHDKKMYTHQDLIKLAEDYGIIVLHNDSAIIEGVHIFGVSKTFPSEDKVEMFEEREEAWKAIPKKVDILVTHIPPKGILDLADRGQNIGCSELKKVVYERAPSYHVFGHCHEYAGWQVHKPNKSFFHNIKFMNVAAKDRNYNLINRKGYEIRL